MYIVHIASELAPIAKVGGLGDVVHGLSKETQRHGNLVEVIIPKYDCIDYSLVKDLKVDTPELWSYDGPYKYNNTVWSASTDGLKIFLLEPHHPAYYFSRGTIYGCVDDIDRFIYFARAALEYLYKAGKRPDIIHLHDWHVALVAPLFKEMYIPLGFKAGDVVLTIHNLQHQGKCSPHNITRAGLRGEDYLLPNKMQDPSSPSLINILKGGIEYSDFVTTVSPTYEKEIKTVDGGCGLNAVLVKHQSKLKGILNGVDQTYWNPLSDSLIPVPYSIENSAKGKEANKSHLRKHFNMKEGKGPLVCSITRLVLQKGPELIKHALLRTLEKDGQFILLGVAPASATDKMFRDLQKEMSKNKNVIIHLQQDEKLAHLVYAASDMIIVPSIFEPCGLTQMIALHYGTVPLVRATGGLADSVFDVDTSKRPEKERNGFVFDFPDPPGVNWVLDRAIECYAKDPKRWQTIVRHGMEMDFSWTKPAQEYIGIYKNLLKKRNSL